MECSNVKNGEFKQLEGTCNNEWEVYKYFLFRIFLD